MLDTFESEVEADFQHWVALGGLDETRCLAEDFERMWWQTMICRHNMNKYQCAHCCPGKPSHSGGTQYGQE